MTGEAASQATDVDASLNLGKRVAHARTPVLERLVIGTVDAITRGPEQGGAIPNLCWHQRKRQPPPASSTDRV